MSSLTVAAIRNAQPGTKPKRLFDGGGLYLEIAPAGGKWWRLKYRFGGKEKRISFGVFPEVSLKEAREKRDEARKKLAQGIDPGEERKSKIKKEELSMDRHGQPAQGEVIIYKSADGRAGLDVHLADETVWLSQTQMVELFQRDQSVISRHLRNVFKEGELAEESNMQKMHIANSDKAVAFYNLDVIISIGYRVKSPRGTQFRIWATSVLRDHLIQGYTTNERRLAEKGLSEMKQAV